MRKNVQKFSKLFNKKIIVSFFMLFLCKGRRFIFHFVPKNSHRFISKLCFSKLLTCFTFKTVPIKLEYQVLIPKLNFFNFFTNIKQMILQTFLTKFLKIKTSNKNFPFQILHLRNYTTSQVPSKGKINIVKKYFFSIST